MTEQFNEVLRDLGCNWRYDVRDNRSVIVTEQSAFDILDAMEEPPDDLSTLAVLVEA